MSEWIKPDDLLPMEGRTIWMVRKCSNGERPITVRGHRIGRSWRDLTNDITFRTPSILWWQYVVVPKPPEPEGPFIVEQFIQGLPEEGFFVQNKQSPFYAGSRGNPLWFQKETTAKRAANLLNNWWSDRD